MKRSPSRPSRFDQRLAVYGSLAPGAEHHAQVVMIRGVWLHGTVCGYMRKLNGQPALEWDPNGPEVPVRVLLSPQLPDHWARLDAFEGDNYQRIVVPVKLASGEITGANIYVRRQLGGQRSPPVAGPT